MYVSHRKRVACRVEILKDLAAVCFGTLVTLDGWVSIGCPLPAAGFWLTVSSFEFRVASFLGLIPL